MQSGFLPVVLNAATALRIVARWQGLRSRVYRRWLIARHGSRITIHPGARILGRISLHKACQLRIGEGSVISDALEVWGSAVVEFAHNVNVIMGVRIYGRGVVRVDQGVVLNATKINCMQSVSIGRDSLIGAGLVTDTDFHNLAPNIRRSPPQPEVAQAVRIGANVWIGYGCIVLKGVNIGNDSVVGAGSVVRSDVPAGVVVSGNPATVVKTFEPSDRSC